MAKEKSTERAICVNRKARHDYIINENPRSRGLC